MPDPSPWDCLKSWVATASSCTITGKQLRMRPWSPGLALQRRAFCRVMLGLTLQRSESTFLRVRMIVTSARNICRLCVVHAD